MGFCLGGEVLWNCYPATKTSFYRSPSPFVASSAGTMASENSPLLAYRLLGEEGAAFPPNGAGGPGVASARKLSTFLGVVVPTVLSMFSIVVFLRIGE